MIYYFEHYADVENIKQTFGGIDSVHLVLDQVAADADISVKGYFYGAMLTEDEGKTPQEIVDSIKKDGFYLFEGEEGLGCFSTISMKDAMDRVAMREGYIHIEAVPTGEDDEDSEGTGEN